MELPTARRTMMVKAGLAAAAAAAGLAMQPVEAAEASLLPAGAATLRDLADRLARAPRRRDFHTVPMILDSPDLWDQEALAEVIAYRGEPRQVWDNTDLASPWLNLMRNSLNSQIWSFRHPDFLAVSATHGTAHLALLDQAMWDKYGLARLTGDKFRTNTLIVEQKAGSADPGNVQDADGAYSGHDNSIPALQRRGVVFIACHNAIWEVSERLIRGGANPDGLSLEALAAELTNHLIPGTVLSPGAVATMLELQMAGFHYAYAK